MKTVVKVLKILMVLLMLFSWMTGNAAAQDKTAKAKKDEPKKAEVLYKKAKRLVHRKDWTEAAKGFKELVTLYSNHSLTDDSLYWLAYSMNRIGRDIENASELLSTQKESLEYLEVLMKKFPSSRFADDAKVLKLDIAEELVEKGFKDYKKVIAIQAAKDDDLEIKINAVRALMNMDPKKAFPILEKLIFSNKEPKLREKAIFVLSQTDDPRVTPTLMKIALNDQDLKVREKAIFWLGQRHEPETLDRLLELYKKLPGEDKTNLKLKEKLVFSISQAEPEKAAKALIDIYKKEKNLKLRKKIIFWLGQSKSNTAAAFIQKILFETP
jgi:tetratricopeptide (TPR) repeat protein